VVDIEPVLPELAKRFFSLSDDPEIHSIIEDGRRFLYDAPQQYDVIFSDVYNSLYSIPPQFTTKEFLCLQGLPSRSFRRNSPASSIYLPGMRGNICFEYR